MRRRWSTFHSFAPAMVDRYVPAVWAAAGPDAVLVARLRAVDRSYRALFGDRVEGPQFAEAAALARRAAEAAGAVRCPMAWATPTQPCPGRTPRT
ncbi:SalK OS=Streptomyces microflavus OX=1919 GN=Smic_30290 PE=4 SV=1 [Streptomyces microflavus]